MLSNGDLNEPLQTLVLHYGRPSIFGGFFSNLKGKKYRITNRGIEIKNGYFLSHVDNIELWRVREIKFVPSFFCSMCAGTGTVVIYADDIEDNESQYKLPGVGFHVYEALKDYVIQMKNIDSGGGIVSSSGFNSLTMQEEQQQQQQRYLSQQGGTIHSHLNSNEYEVYMEEYVDNEVDI
jgi:hypothetical protein